MPSAAGSRDHDDDDRTVSHGRQDRIDPRVLQTRSRVIAAARRVIAEAGITGASIERIAAQSGVARSTIYRRWPDLNALYADALLAADPDTLEPATPTGDIRADLRRYLTEYAEWLNDPAQFSLLLSLVLLAARDPRFVEVHRRTIHEPVSRVVRLIEDAQRTGLLRSDVDKPYALVLLLSPCLYVRMIEQRPITPRLVEVAVDEFMQRFAV